jgi:hypothetical protein
LVLANAEEKMHINLYSHNGKIRLGLLLVVFLFTAADLPAAHAQAGVTPAPTFMENGLVVSAVPLNFSKNTPTNGATVQGTTVTLDWGTAGTDITGYYHCFDKTDNGICDGNQWNWNNDTNRTLSNLDIGGTYYWQILACNLTACVGANNGQWWSFTITPLPAAQAREGVTPTPGLMEKDPVEMAVPLSFSKQSPTYGETVQAIKVTLEWASAGTYITGYYHCADKTNNGICDVNKWDWNDDTNRSLLNMDPGSSHYWQILACNNEACVGANNGQWWYFKTAFVFRGYMPLVRR